MRSSDADDSDDEASVMDDSRPQPRKARRRSRSQRRRTNELIHGGPRPMSGRASELAHGGLQSISGCTNEVTYGGPQPMSGSRNKVTLGGPGPISNCPNEVTQGGPQPISGCTNEVANGGPQPTSGGAVDFEMVNKWQFACQLAHGSVTRTVSGFGTLSDLYEAIAECYEEVDASDILFCTVNTDKLRMDKLLSSNLALSDLIFAHTRGITKQLTFVKSEQMLGLTISDNGAGKTFVKRIKEDSMCAKASPAISVGDHIESLNGMNLIGKRHFEVAKLLRMIPVGSTMTMRLVEPKKAAVIMPSGRKSSAVKKGAGVSVNKRTLRFKSTGTAVIQEVPSSTIVSRINEVFDAYLGFHDDDLAQTVWEIAAECENVIELGDAIRKSEVGKFEFPEELVFDLWGVVDDWSNSRIVEETPADLKARLAKEGDQDGPRTTF